MEDNGNKKNVDVVSGASAAVGSTIGMVAGTFIDSELHAAEVVPTPMPEPAPAPMPEPAPSSTPSSTISEETPVTVTSVQEETVTEPVSQSQHNNSNNNTEIEVMAYETVTDEYGNEMDVALLDVDGQQVMLFDVDKDGTADVMVADANSDNMIEDNEIVDVVDYNISMDTFEKEMGNDYTNESLAYNDDYVNDADVTDFMA